MKWKTCFISLMLLLLLCMMQQGMSVRVDDTVIIQCDNENYAFPASGLSLDNIRINDTWVRFNDVGINISTVNPINISVSYLNNNIIQADMGDRVLRFTAETNTGKVWFNLSGFRANSDYKILRDSGTWTTKTTDATGILSFSNNDWSNHDFDISYHPFDPDDDWISEKEEDAMALYMTTILYILLLLAFVLVVAGAILK